MFHWVIIRNIKQNLIKSKNKYINYYLLFFGIAPIVTAIPIAMNHIILFIFQILSKKIEEYLISHYVDINNYDLFNC